MDQVPKKIQHVAIIMDGNGRWAQRRNHARIWGHIRGANVVSKIVEKASNMKLTSLTLFAFSTENWVRPEKEVKTLFLLLHKFVIKERSRIIKNKIRFATLGGLDRLPTFIREKVELLESETKDNTGLQLNIAFDYGARDEIFQAAKSLVEKSLPPTLENFESQLQSSILGLNNIDLLIRTGGVYRISNFLLWSCAYAELFFLERPWPLFTPEDLENICLEVEARERRFGDTTNSGNARNLKDVTAKAVQKRDNFVW